MNKFSILLLVIALSSAGNAAEKNIKIDKTSPLTRRLINALDRISERRDMAHTKLLIQAVLTLNPIALDSVIENADPRTLKRWTTQDEQEKLNKKFLACESLIASRIKYIRYFNLTAPDDQQDLENLRKIKGRLRYMRFPPINDHSIYEHSRFYTGPRVSGVQCIIC